MSDVRLKKNILSIGNAIEIVQGLRGVYYEWKEPNSLVKGRQVGFIAQETMNVLPEVVDNSGDYYTIQYAPITAVLVEGMKQQHSQIEELKLENEELKQKLNEIIKMLEEK